MTAPRQVTAFSPASIGNIAVGFDILGHSIAGIGDRATVRRITSPEVRIGTISGSVVDLPRNPAHNTAGQALLSLRERAGLHHGFEIDLQKGIPLGSGLGGSAASAVAALVAANATLDAPVSRDLLYQCALDGEAVASGSRHGDNVAPMLWGGIMLVTEHHAISLKAPTDLHVALVHPDQVLETRVARQVLIKPYALADFVKQSEHLAIFLHGLHTANQDLIAAGLKDVLVEPRRAELIPGFAAVKNAALGHHALGASISGAGPSIFAWFASKKGAEIGAEAMTQAFSQNGIKAQSFVSPVNGPRAEVES